ncbi:hypothetical protein Agabi119p4_10298 [Agaricus bisporus var. burnettii]|uniref:Uncharacterized protein n=1 Tax=Agaricus bisporus var. burnettii TaxID=192524 RepID=A0A8H7C1A2_AGABI|nr:hypothetical protein Agabi119p4_10298 [Agaricus bisporus var. burnettii]
MGHKTDNQHSSISSPGADSVLIPSKSWSYDAEFGIVHLCGCAVCRNYMLHVSDQAAGKSYGQALAERDAELRDRFFEGFRRGRTAQLERDTERLQTCRSERNVARDQVSVYEVKVDEAEKEIARLKDELFALRIAYDEVASDNNNSTFSDDDGSSVSDTDHDDEYCGYGGSSDGVSEDEITAVEHDAIEDDGALELPDSSYRPFTEPPPNRPPTFTPPTVAEDLDTSDQEATNQSLFSSSTSSSPGAPPTSSAVDEIRRKMKLAHLPGQGEILAEIKSLISKTHKTHNSQRTEVQKVLMLEWRRPSLTVTYESPTPPPVASFSEPEEIVDVYVDASGTGIGFYLLGRWQAWKLKKGWKSVKGRDIQWAEAVAVEMGVLLLLKAGYAQKKIRLHSDNRQVVDAFSAENFDQAHVGPIVQLCTDLCCTYGLDCTVEWVPGVENPADNPSRFLFLDKNKRFPCDIMIPHALQEFVLPYCLPE